MKKITALLLFFVVAVTAAVACGGCTGEDKDYFKNVSGYSFWDNEGSEAIAQYKFYNIMTPSFRRAR